jgi:hypothetical protein
MGRFTPCRYTHIALLVLAGLLILIGAAPRLETKAVNLAEEELAPAAAVRGRERPELA